MNLAEWKLRCLVCGGEEFTEQELRVDDNSKDDSEYIYGGPSEKVYLQDYPNGAKDNIEAHVCHNCGYVLFFDTDLHKDFLNRVLFHKTGQAAVKELHTYMSGSGTNRSEPTLAQELNARIHGMTPVDMDQLRENGKRMEAFKDNAKGAVIDKDILNS